MIKRSTIIRLLRGLADRSIKNNVGYGICYELAGLGMSYIDVERIMEHAKTWNKYSGNFRYPIPHQSMSARMAFQMKNLWSVWRWKSADRQYARDRRELCKYIADRLENEHT